MMTDHLSVGVEIQDANAAEHPHAIREVQELRIETEQTYEKSIFTVNNVDDGYYRIIYQHINKYDNMPNVTDDISAKASASTFRNAIKDIIKAFSGSDVAVVLEMFDSSDVITTDAATAVKYKYTVTLTKLINGQSFTTGQMKASTTKTATAATLELI